MTDMTKQPFVLAARQGARYIFLDAAGNWTSYSHEVATFPTRQAAYDFRKPLGGTRQSTTHAIRKWWNN